MFMLLTTKCIKSSFREVFEFNPQNKKKLHNFRLKLCGKAELYINSLEDI